VSKSVPNLSEIEQSEAEFDNLADFWPLHHAVTLTFDPLTLNVYRRLGVMWLNSVPNPSDIEQSSAELLTL